MNVAPVKPGDPAHDAACEALGVPTPAALDALAATLKGAVREIFDAVGHDPAPRGTLPPEKRRTYEAAQSVLGVAAQLQAVAPQAPAPATTAEQQAILDLDRRVAVVEAQLDTLARIARAMQAADEGADGPGWVDEFGARLDAQEAVLQRLEAANDLGAIPAFAESLAQVNASLADLGRRVASTETAVAHMRGRRPPDREPERAARQPAPGDFGGW